MVSEIVQQKARREFTELRRELLSQLFGVHPAKVIVKRQNRPDKKVLYSLVERGQCDDCLYWFPYEELTPDGEDRSLCQQCASIAGRW